MLDLELIYEAGMLDSKPSPTPSDPSIRLHDDLGTLLSDPSSYYHLIGRLIYLTNTWLDINFVIQQLSQFVSCPREPQYATMVGQN